MKNINTFIHFLKKKTAHFKYRNRNQYQIVNTWTWMFTIFFNFRGKMSLEDLENKVQQTIARVSFIKMPFIVNTP